MRDIFRPNQLIEIELGTGAQDEQSECFASRIEEVLPQSLVVAAPIKHGALLHVAAGEIITLRLHFDGIPYSALCRVQSRSNQGLPLLKITRPENISRVQQRSWVRIEVLLPLEYRMAGYPIDYYQTTTADLSGGGCLMVANHPIDLDTLLDLRLTISESFILECQGRVTRSQQVENSKKRHKIGIRFENLNDATIDRIVAFIFQKQRESLKKGNLSY